MSTSRDDFGIAVRSALLQKGAKQKFSLFFLISIALLLFFLETYNIKFISTFRSLTNDGIYRVASVATSPLKLISNATKEAKKIIFIHKENKILKEENIRLKKKEFNVEFLTNQNNNLNKIIEKNSDTNNDFILAKVILDKNSPYLKSIVINKGTNVGITKGMPVLEKNNLVGRIVETNYLSSRILLLNDLNSRIPVTLGKDSSQGILAGIGSNYPTIEYLPEDYIPSDGENVFTSGKDGIFSSGIPVGAVQKIGKNVNVKLFSDPNQLAYVTVQLIEIEDKNF